MPELPEVETVRSGLQRLLPGRVVARVKYDWPRGFPNSQEDVDKFIVGAKIAAVRRRAKVLLIDLSSGYTLVIHLKMTGQLVFVGAYSKVPSSPRRRGSSQNNQDIRFGAGHPNESLVGKLPDKSTRVTLNFEDGSHLYFNDQRKFGWVKLVKTGEVENLKFIFSLGPEPLDDDFTWQGLKKRLERRSKTGIKAALLDQTVIAGIGNIYSDESLWGAKIHPSNLVGSLTDTQFKNLFNSIQNVLKLSLEKGGSTDRNYVDAEGKKGSYLSFAKVFRRENQPCPRCGTKIIKIRVAGRGTHICPSCQQITDGRLKLL